MMKLTSPTSSRITATHTLTRWPRMMSAVSIRSRSIGIRPRLYRAT